MSMHLHSALTDPIEDSVFDPHWLAEAEILSSSGDIEAVCKGCEPPDRLCTSCRSAIDDPSIPFEELDYHPDHGDSYEFLADRWARNLDVAA